MVDKGQQTLSMAEVFRVFLLAGLTFGGGLAIVTILERELVRDRQALTRDDFFAYYALARVVPTGTQTALAVSIGNHLAGLKGSFAAVIGLVTPAVATALALTVALTSLPSTAVEIMPQTILPAAVALIAVGAISMGKDLVGFKRETALAAAAFAAAWLLNVPPGIVLITGGFIGLLLFRGEVTT